MSLPIETSRLRLRRYRESDTPDVVAYSSDPSIARIVNWRDSDGAITAESVREFIQAQNQVQPGDRNWMDLAICLKSEDRVIGSIGIIRRNHQQGQAGWALSTSHRRQGIATEAAGAMLEYGFTVLRLHRIYAETTSWNRRSWLLMERLGMRREACFRESEQVDGAWTDGLIYALLRTEWADFKPGMTIVDLHHRCSGPDD
jgi:aminoglycoside 6'-N-acetyltransferase